MKIKSICCNKTHLISGGIPHEKLIPYFQDACMFIQHSVQPSYGDAEGTPNTILEASTAALPVISTKHAGIPKAVIDTTTGFLVEEYDSKAMTDAMVRLFNDKTRCQSMGEAGRSHIQSNYNIERHIGVLEHQLYMAIKI